MSTSSFWKKHTGGESLVFHEHGNEARWYDAIGPNTRKWEMRLGSDLTTAKEYTVTEIGAGGTEVQGITAGIRATLTTNTDKWDEINIQLIGTPFQLAAGYPLYFGAKFAVDSATLSDFFVGLSATDTAILSAGADTLDIGGSALGFYALAGTTITSLTEIHASGSKTNTSDTVLTTNAMTYEFVWDGVDGVSFYHEGALVGRHTTYVPTVVLCPSIVIKAASAAARIASISWMRCIQLA